MNQHDDIRDLLTLAAAGALDAAEQRSVAEHLRQCAGCRAELESWQRLTGALEALPTPQAPLGLVERTRRQLEARVSVQAERSRKRALLVWLTVLGWASTLLTWPLFQLLGGRIAGALDLSSQGLNQVWIGYLVASWTIGVVAAGLLGQRHQQEGRTL
ncbi:MAG TPA: zf-HC2 domain-containing protein [Candidatus Angelobacter sp.]|nr:zf-HC2 domain-containing protein [Candidatus Angelobacter sp.]